MYGKISTWLRSAVTSKLPPLKIGRVIDEDGNTDPTSKLIKIEG